MELNSILVVVSAVVVVVAIWLFVGHRQLKFLHERVGRAWESVDEKYRKRQDVVPNLVETVRLYIGDKEELIDGVIQARAAAARAYIVGRPGEMAGNKLELEEALKAKTLELLALGEGNAAAKDTNFLQLKKEIGDLNNEIEKLFAGYSGAIDKYNNLCGRAFMAPVAAIFRHKKIL